MNKNVTYIGGYPRVRCAGYAFRRGEPVEVPAELADRLIDAQDDDPISEPLFSVEDAE